MHKLTKRLTAMALAMLCMITMLPVNVQAGKLDTNYTHPNGYVDIVDEEIDIYLGETYTFSDGIIAGYVYGDTPISNSNDPQKPNKEDYKRARDKYCWYKLNRDLKSFTFNNNPTKNNSGGWNWDFSKLKDGTVTKVYVGWLTKEKYTSDITYTKTYQFTNYIPQLSETKMSLGYKESNTLTLTCNYPKQIKWKSSNPKIATVKNGKVTAKSKAGTCKITATYMGYKYTCEVTVGKTSVKQHTIALKAGDTAKVKLTGGAKIKSVKAEYYGHTTDYKLVTAQRGANCVKNELHKGEGWETRIDNPTSVKVKKDGTITAKMPGNALLTITDTKGNTYYVTTTVTCNHDYKLTKTKAGTWSNFGYNYYTCKKCKLHSFEYRYYETTEEEVQKKCDELVAKWNHQKWNAHDNIGTYYFYNYFDNSWEFEERFPDYDEDDETTWYPGLMRNPGERTASCLFGGCNDLTAMFVETCFGANNNAPTVYASNLYGVADDEDGNILYDSLCEKSFDIAPEYDIKNWTPRVGDMLSYDSGHHVVVITKVYSRDDKGAWVDIFEGNAGGYTILSTRCYIQKGTMGTYLYMGKGQWSDGVDTDHLCPDRVLTCKEYEDWFRTSSKLEYVTNVFTYYKDGK